MGVCQQWRSSGVARTEHASSEDAVHASQSNARDGPADLCRLDDLEERLQVFERWHPCKIWSESWMHSLQGNMIIHCTTHRPT